MGAHTQTPSLGRTACVQGPRQAGEGWAGGGGGGHLLSCLLQEVGEKVITRTFGGLGLDRRADAKHRRSTSS